MIAAESIASLLSRDRIEQLQRERRRSDPKDLAAYGFCAYSQNDEDGILQEIFARIGTTDRTFIEFGCGNGLENNTTYLLLTGWRGVWIDSGAEEVASARRVHAEAIQSGILTVDRQVITAENIDQILTRLWPEREVDLLSIDIDGNDYWVWSAIQSVVPRVVVIEYNATFRPPVDVAQAYRPEAQWNGTNYFGASLSALQRLGESKGFSLAGCNLSGSNAFFIRNDCLGDRFSAPYTAERHYAPPNYDLFSLSKGHTHPPSSGKYIVNPPTHPISPDPPEAYRMEALPVFANGEIEIAGQAGSVSHCRPGARLLLPVIVKNNSSRELRSLPPYPVHLAYHWLSSPGRRMVVFDGERTPLCQQLRSLGSESYEMLIHAPGEPGHYLLRITLVQEGVRWFDEPPEGCFWDVPIEVRSER